MLFSKEKVNSNRQIEIDLAKGFAFILLIIFHVGLYLGTKDNKVIWTIADIVGSEPAAPVFMTLMGIGIVYSKHNNSKDMFN